MVFFYFYICGVVYLDYPEIFWYKQELARRVFLIVLNSVLVLLVFDNHGFQHGSFGVSIAGK